MEKYKQCLHEHFEAKIDVHRLAEDNHPENILDYTADLSIHCAQCGQPFEFIGFDAGVSFSYPCVSVDATEARLPIRPSKLPIKKDPNKVYN